MSNKVTQMSAYREPIMYSVHITSHWDGQFGISISGVGSEAPSQAVREMLIAQLHEAIRIIQTSQ